MFCQFSLSYVNVSIRYASTLLLYVHSSLRYVQTLLRYVVKSLRYYKHPFDTDEI